MNTFARSIIALLASLTIIGATPVPPTIPVDIDGTVVSFVWMDETHFEGGGERLRVTSGGDKAQYIIILKTKSLDAKTRESLTSLTRIAGLAGISHMITRLEILEDEMFIHFSSAKIPNLKAGSKLKLEGYSLSGDESGISSTVKKITVDGKVHPNMKWKKQNKSVDATARSSIVESTSIAPTHHL